ncbi:hypothetical protein EDC27_1136 [Desulfosoma caldarium]|uniref:Uncharacterized protein n=1 Tax=Desulfosoma caldarium TaxID=610254 RepID=A0A3N1VJ44_9BACT|nr:hypothetical protein EDC27_1136 [Desulfosoma caldarium]
MKGRKLKSLIIAGVGFLGLAWIFSCSFSGDKEPQHKTSLDESSHRTNKNAPQATSLTPGTLNDRQQAGAPEARLVSIQFDPSRPVTGDTLRVLVTVEGANPDENDVLIHWNVNGQDKEETGTVLQSSLHYGDWVTATAEFPGQGEKRQLLSASVFVENAPPIIGIARESTDDGEYVAVLQTEDPEKDAVALRLVEAPEGMILDTATKTLRWRPDSNLSANVFQVTVEGVDSAGNIARYRFDISVSRP